MHLLFPTTYQWIGLASSEKERQKITVHRHRIEYWGKHIHSQWIRAGGWGNKRIARAVTLYGFIVGSDNVKDHT